MSEEANELTEGLVRLAGSAAPESRVDAGAAVRAGRARLRRRRLGVAGAAATVLVLVSTLSVALPGHGGGASGPASDATQSAVPLDKRSPLNIVADFGWLPEGLETFRYSLASYGVTVRAEGVKPEQGMVMPPMYQLEMFAEGVTPELGTFPNGSHAIKRPAPDVNGQEAYWLWSDDPGYAQDVKVLRWKSADGRWLELRDLYVPKEEREQLVLRIAANVVVGTKPIPLPLRLNGVPADFRLISASFERRTRDDRPKWTAEVNFASGPHSSIGTTVTPDDPRFDVNATTTPPGMIVKPRTCKSADGVRVCTMSMQEDAFDAVGGPKSWLEKVTLLGADESKWTADVLR
ncbi:hypothetical protein [Kitasatospora camelliae]|uniref:Uncharacterized protein n=1 Tax=Kitasatospora camelliae TaxID=3156397 RepID=A0AAU8JU42_9ACTN